MKWTKTGHTRYVSIFNEHWIICPKVDVQITVRVSSSYLRDYLGLNHYTWLSQVLVRFPDDVKLGVLCPITLDVMRDPVVAADGETYERAAIVVCFL
jgi:hypothetical protein